MEFTDSSDHNQQILGNSYSEVNTVGLKLEVQESDHTSQSIHVSSCENQSRENITHLRFINTQELDRFWIKNRTKASNQKPFKMAVVLLGQVRNFPFDWQYKDQINDHLLAPFRENPEFDVHVILVTCSNLHS